MTARPLRPRTACSVDASRGGNMQHELLIPLTVLSVCCVHFNTDVRGATLQQYEKQAGTGH